MSCMGIQHWVKLDIDAELAEEKLSESHSKAKNATDDETVENLDVEMSWDVAGGLTVLHTHCFSRSWSNLLDDTTDLYYL